MISFDKPKNLNGSELRAELNNAGIIISDNINAVIIDSDGKLWLDIEAAMQFDAAAIVSSHKGTIKPPELTIDQKLASVGLSINDLKTALGI